MYNEPTHKPIREPLHQLAQQSVFIGRSLAEIAALKGYANKAEFIRVIFDDALAENAKALKKTQRTAKT